MLGDVEPYRDWLNRERPSEQAIKVVVGFISAASDRPWAHPSYPADVTGQPIFEVRAVALTVPGEAEAYIRYRRTYASEQIDLLHVTTVTR